MIPYLLIIIPFRKGFPNAASYVYDIIDNEHFKESIPVIIACNKQDVKFAKASNIVENELVSEIENLKKFKQTTTLEDNTEQFGTLYVWLYYLIINILIILICLEFERKVCF